MELKISQNPKSHGMRLSTHSDCNSNRFLYTLFITHCECCARKRKNDCEQFPGIRLMLKLVNAIRSWACLNPDCSQIGTCHTALNPLKVDLPAAWLQGISLHISKQEKPLGWPEGAESRVLLLLLLLLTQRPHLPSVPAKMALSLQRAFSPHLKYTDLLYLYNVG